MIIPDELKVKFGNLAKLYIELNEDNFEQKVKQSNKSGS